MSDSKRRVRLLLVLSPLLLTGCDKLDLASLDLPSITLPWDDAKPSTPPTIVALRADTVEIAQAPDGMQMDDWSAPFGAPSPVAASSP
jgi:hypothetical protein